MILMWYQLKSYQFIHDFFTLDAQIKSVFILNGPTSFILPIFLLESNFVRAFWRKVDKLFSSQVHHPRDSSRHTWGNFETWVDQFQTAWLHIWKKVNKIQRWIRNSICYACSFGSIRSMDSAPTPAEVDRPSPEANTSSETEVAYHVVQNIDRKRERLMSCKVYRKGLLMFFGIAELKDRMSTPADIYCKRNIR